MIDGDLRSDDAQDRGDEFDENPAAHHRRHPGHANPSLSNEGNEACARFLRPWPRTVCSMTEHRTSSVGRARRSVPLKARHVFTIGREKLGKQHSKILSYGWPRSRGWTARYRHTVRAFGRHCTRNWPVDIFTLSPRQGEQAEKTMAVVGAIEWRRKRPHCCFPWIASVARNGVAC